MSIRYLTDCENRRFEVTLRIAPSYTPQGGGNDYQPTAEDCDCRFCLYADPRGRCALDYCACAEERAAAGLASPHVFGGRCND
jgi:hypothetical protein